MDYPTYVHGEDAKTRTQPVFPHAVLGQSGVERFARNLLVSEDSLRVFAELCMQVCGILEAGVCSSDIVDISIKLKRWATQYSRFSLFLEIPLPSAHIAITGISHIA